MKLLRSVSHTSGAIFLVVVFIAIIALTVVDRANGVTSSGIIGTDTFEYWRAALAWLRNGSTPENWYRPISLIFFSGAIKLFGYSDYSIRLANICLDLFNIGLVFWFGRYYLNSCLLALGAAAIYASLPAAIFFSRSELLHTLSLTFLTLALCFLFLESNSYKKSVRKQPDKQGNGHLGYLLLCGISIGLACQVHSSIFAMLPGFYLSLLFLRIYSDSKEAHGFFCLFKTWSIFSLSFLLSFVPALYYFSVESAVFTILKNHQLMSDLSMPVSTSPMNLTFFVPLCDYISSNVSKYTYIVFLLSCLVVFYFKLKKKLVVQSVVPLLIIISFVLCLNTFAGIKTLARLFFPLTPLLIVYLLYWHRAFFELFCTKEKSVQLTMCASILILLSCRFSFPIYVNQDPIDTFASIFVSARLPNSIYKEVYSHVLEGDYLHEGECKILILPSIIYREQYAFKFEMYFGDRAVYAIDVQEDLESYIRSSEICLFYFAKSGYAPLLEDPDFMKADKFGLSQSDYSVRKEFQVFTSLFAKNELRLLNKFEHGTLYAFSR